MRIQKSNEAQIFLIPVMPNTATPKLKQDHIQTPYYKSRQKPNPSLPTQKPK
jgi:hypothetical protein